jgi:N-acetylglucosamine malate deacetylase 1
VASSTEWQPAGSNISFHPNWFESVVETFDYKIKALKSYQSEMREWPHPRSLKNIEYLARYRGSSIGCEYAEGFMLLRATQ